MISIRYIGALLDSSGYASAGRQYVKALHDTGQVDITTVPCTFEQEKTQHGALQELVVSLRDKATSPKIQIVHLTPDNFPAYHKRGIYNIGYTVWETDRLPDRWASYCNMMDELWVPSTWNKEVFKQSGVTKPIYVVPHVIADPLTQPTHQVDISSPDTFVFYSICQWLERKNPITLLKAYLTEFSPEEKVVLALKSYRIDTSPAEQGIVKADISQVKKGLRLEKYPQILFFGNLMPYDYILGLHARGECFVLPTRGEGFGIPIAEAMAMGKPIITSRYGGSLDYLNDSNSFLINCQETPVYGMLFPNYNGTMQWGDPSVSHLKKLMRYVFENRDEAKQIGALAREQILQYCDSGRIGNLMVQRLREVDSSSPYR